MATRITGIRSRLARAAAALTVALSLTVLCVVGWLWLTFPVGGN